MHELAMRLGQLWGAPKSSKLKMSNGTTLENQWFGVPLIQETPNSTEIKRLESPKSFKLRHICRLS
jgi:hypothetical protein